MINTGRPDDNAAAQEQAVGDLLGMGDSARKSKDNADNENQENAGARRSSVEAVLDAFKKGNRDVNNAYLIIKDRESNSTKEDPKERDEENIGNILLALEQLTDILNKVTYFSKANDILRAATRDINGSPSLYELLARQAFIMEDFNSSIKYNKKAAQLQPDDCSHNKSDIGLAYYRLGLLGEQKHFESGFKFCREALELNPMNAMAMVNMGLIYKQQNGIEDAMKMFKAARQHDPQNIAAIVNIGCIEYEEHQRFDEAAILFLDALEIKPDDEEALCNLALALKRTTYLDYAKMAFEEAVNVAPGNTFILTNYMMFLLEQQNFEQFGKVLPHARRVMDRQELETIQKLHDEFREAIDGTAGKTIPEDEVEGRAGAAGASATSAKIGGVLAFSKLRAQLNKSKQGGAAAIKQPAADL